MTRDRTDLADITIEVHLEGQSREEIEAEIRAGLEKRPREISPRFFYDDRGSTLFEEICTLPEYYQTRTERSILNAVAADVVELTGARELVELGSGAATKTRVLLDAMDRAGQLRRYIPFDVNEAIVRRTAGELTDRHPDLAVHGVIGDFTSHLHHIPDGDHRLVIFLGGTIGNFGPEDAKRFLGSVASEMAPGDWFLLGTDLIKDPARLEAAYNDSRGVTAAFNRNVLSVVNHTVGSDFDPEAFEHRAPFNREEHRIEMWLRARTPQRVTIPALDMVLDFAEGERILTEISTKFDRDKVTRLLDAAGITLEAWYPDPENLFALSLGRLR